MMGAARKYLSGRVGVLLAVVASLLLGWAWALASPVGASFPAVGMGLRVDNPNNPIVPVPTSSPAGYNLKATFATIEDFKRAVDEAGVYVKASVADDGKSIQFTSTLAGAYLTVSEDTDCYEQMNDKYQQLSGLNLDGLVKGVNTDSYGNV